MQYEKWVKYLVELRIMQIVVERDKRTGITPAIYDAIKHGILSLKDCHGSAIDL